ncbi:MAG: hypothetical protein OEV46_09235 [Betaproteobacteria bacterium]|jgi:hypothetical protein|nr:hypothetical protein [Betaproteobacteria bacterium]
MLKNAESVLFFLATVAALALPAVPALQEMRTAHITEAQSATAAATPVADSLSVPPSSRQVAMVR